MVIRMTKATRKVLWALLDVEECYGLAIVHRTRLAGGTVYPILARLERHGCVLSRWDCADSADGPRRRFYRLTPAGLTLALDQEPLRPDPPAGSAGPPPPATG